MIAIATQLHARLRFLHVPVTVQARDGLDTEQANTTHLRRLEAAGQLAMMVYTKRVRRAELERE